MDKDPDRKHWEHYLEAMADDCKVVKGRFRTCLKLELISAIGRFVAAQERGDAAPGPDLMPHTTHHNPRAEPQPQAPPLPMMYNNPQPSTSAGIMFAQPQQQVLANTSVTIPASQVAALHGAYPQFVRPVGCSTPVYRGADMSLQIPSSSFMNDYFGGSQPSTPARSTADHPNPADQTLNTPQKPPQNTVN